MDKSTPTGLDWEGLCLDGKKPYAKRYEHEPIEIDGVA